MNKFYYVASCSCGKDSLAMVLLLLEKNYPLNEVIYFDTGMEFDAIYRNIEKLKGILEKEGVIFTHLKPKNSFEYNAFERTVNKRNGTKQNGYGWCGGMVRWGTSEKVQTIRKHFKQIDKPIVEYIGVAGDEQPRIKHVNDDTVKIYPLAEWQMTEKDCLEYCYSNGWNWEENGIELYSILDRVSCWCCANKNIKELKNMYYYLPSYWSRLKDFEQRCGMPYKKKGVDVFEERFKKEGIQIKLLDFEGFR